MIVDELKKSILQSALSGKLSHQLPTDTTVEDMLKSIKEKKQKVKSRIDKFDNITPEELPFNIPKTWKWVELKDISLDIYAGGDKPKKFSKNKTDKYKIPVIANGEANYGIVGYSDLPTENEPSLTVAGRGTIGYSVFRSEPFIPIVRLLVIKLPTEVNYKYLQKVFALLLEQGVGTSIKQLTVPMIVNKLIPLPPIEEQQRIVDKIEELFQKLSIIKPIEENIDNLKKQFPNEMYQSIIFAALTGKLSFQNNNESSQAIIENIKKNTKVSPKIIVDNTPFNVPSNWTWIKFGDLVDFNIGKTPPRSDDTYWADYEYNWISISDMKDGGYISTTKEYVSQKAFDQIFKGKICKKGTLIMSFKMSVGKCSILNIDSFHHEGIISIYPKTDQQYSEVIKLYLFKILSFMTKYANSKKAIKGMTLNSKSLSELLIPLPPIEEQKRIIDKIDKLSSICEEINTIVS